MANQGRYPMLLVFMQFAFCGSLVVGQSVNDCQIQLSDYNLTVLKSPATWVIHGQPCGNVTSDTSCSYYFSICHPIKKPEINTTCANSGVCQVDDTVSPPKVRPLGEFSTVKYQDKSGAPGPGNSLGIFQIRYAQPQGPGLDADDVTLTFNCNNDVKWTTTGEVDEEAQVPAGGLIGVVHGGYDAMWSLQFKYPGACKAVKPKSSSLNGGVIFIIVVLCLIATYIIVGCIYGRIQGKSGFDAMPNADLWRSCGSKIAGGCGTACATCKGGPGGGSGGKGYEQL